MGRQQSKRRRSAPPWKTPRRKRKPQWKGGCGKLRYRDKVEALIALSKIDRMSVKQEKRAYFCSDCNGWHLTSQALKRYR